MERQLATVQVIGDIEPIPDADKIGFIYKITNNLNGKMYIGKSTSKNLHDLKKRYVRDVKYRTSHSRYIINSMRLHGFENFNFEIIEFDIPENRLNDLEKYYIKIFNTMSSDVGYNLTIGGEGTNGFTWDDESKQKLSAIQSDGRYKGLKNPFYGKTHDQLTKDKIIASNKRRLGSTHTPHSRETKEKIRKSLLGKVPWNKGIDYIQIKGEKNHRYKHVDKDILRDLIREDHHYLEICKILNISPTCFYSKLKEFDLKGEYDDRKKKVSVCTDN